MENFLLFNPHCVNINTTKPLRQIKTAVTRLSTTAPIVFPDYFKTDVQFRKTEYSMYCSKQSRQTQVRRKSTQSKNDTRCQSRIKLYRSIDSQTRIFTNMDNGQSKQIRTEGRNIQSHNEPRYLIKKNNRWGINKIHRNIARSINYDEVLLEQKPCQSDDFFFALAISYGISYSPTDNIKAISIKNNSYVLESIKKRDWWVVKDTDPCLTWKVRSTVTQSFRHKLNPLSLQDCLQYLSKQYPIAKLLWPNSKQRNVIPYIKPQPPYLLDFKQHFQNKLCVISSKQMKLFSRINHKKYLQKTYLYQNLPNDSTMFPLTYFQSTSINFNINKWIICIDGQIKIVDPLTLSKLILKPFDYYQQFIESKAEQKQQIRTKGIVLVVIINGLLKVFLYQQCLQYLIKYQNNKITRKNERIVHEFPMFHQTSILINKLFSKIYKKILTKVHCFEIFEIELVNKDQNILFTSIKPSGQNKQPIFKNIIQNLFLIVIDPIFRSHDYKVQDPYEKNKFSLVFDSFIKAKQQI